MLVCCYFYDCLPLNVVVIYLNRFCRPVASHQPRRYGNRHFAILTKTLSLQITNMNANMSTGNNCMRNTNSSLNGWRDKNRATAVCICLVWQKANTEHGTRSPRYLVDNLFCNHTLWAFCYHYHYRHNYYDLVIKFMKCIRLLKYSQGSTSKKPTKSAPTLPLCISISEGTYQLSSSLPFLYVPSFKTMNTNMLM